MDDDFGAFGDDEGGVEDTSDPFDDDLSSDLSDSSDLGSDLADEPSDDGMDLSSDLEGDDLASEDEDDPFASGAETSSASDELDDDDIGAMEGGLEDGQIDLGSLDDDDSDSEEPEVAAAPAGENPDSLADELSGLSLDEDGDGMGDLLGDEEPKQEAAADEDGDLGDLLADEEPKQEAADEDGDLGDLR